MGRGIFEREMELGKEWICRDINQTFCRGNEPEKISFAETFFKLSIAKGLCSLHIEILSQILQSLQLVRNFYTCLPFVSTTPSLYCFSLHLCYFFQKKKKKKKKKQSQWLLQVAYSPKFLREIISSLCL